MCSARRMLLVLCLALVLLLGQRASAAPPYPELRDSHDSALQAHLDAAFADEALFWDGVRKREFSAVVVDVTDLRKPRVAGYNADLMLYAASLPKVAIVLGALIEIDRGVLPLGDETHQQLVAMVKKSSNASASAVLRKVGIERLAEILQDPAYGRLYDPEHGGGLWVGKAYDKTPVWRRDPLHGLSHGASAMQVARLYYGLMTSSWTDAKYLPLAEEIFGAPGLQHKFVKGLQGREVEIFRKSGTWKNFHADSAVIARDGLSYIAVSIDTIAEAGADMPRGIRTLDDAMLDWSGR